VIYREQTHVRMDAVDALGIAYFARYWDWYESCFEAFMGAASGGTWRDIVDSGLGFPFVRCEMDYHEAVHLSDVVTVELALVRVGNRSFEFRGRFSIGEGTIVANATSVHAGIRLDGSPAELPTWLREAVVTTPREDAR
jgi:YbgC/YbaW family acyl-CoA thioester hydrolase